MTEMMEASSIRSLAFLFLALTLSLGSAAAQSSGPPLLPPVSGSGSPGTHRDSDSRASATNGTASVQLADGRMMVTGGRDARNESHRDIRFYNPATGVWTTGASMLFRRADHSATLLADGRVLVVGGGRGDSANPEIYDPERNCWTIAGTMARSLFEQGSSSLGYVTFLGGTLETLGDGRILAIGTNGTGMQIYDPVQDQWSLHPSAGAWDRQPVEQ